tara:strand:+ start:51 stop:659 length:609 start_codon:yes stop_codon:yes gene_type:complete
MKLTRKQLKRIVLKEFKINPDYKELFDTPGNGNLPPIETPGRGGGGGRQKLHQIIRIDLAPDKKSDPSAYSKVAIDLTLLSQMMDLYDSLSHETKQILYMPASSTEFIDPKDKPQLSTLRRLFFDMYQTILDNSPQGPYDLFNVYHPNFEIINGTFDLTAEVEASITQLDKLSLYEKVAGYEVDKDLLHNYELIMHSCGSLV